MLSDEVREYILERAKQSNIDPDKLDLEPGPIIPGKLYRQVTGIYAGALDEEFFMAFLYEVNVADWLAEFYENVASESGSDEDWQVDVYQAFYNGEDLNIGDLIYRKSSSD